ncbi:acyltransferase [Dysgonomonadaceae bacterium zrk40]|nr:acyltransferase [Dysgonomonadaceae bacterium zrk40]
MLTSIVEKIKSNPKLKQRVLFLMLHPVKTRPRLWLRALQFLYMKKGKRSVIYRSVRKDIVPFNGFNLGKSSVIEDYAIVNNAVGDIVIGDFTRIGMGNTIIGPVMIGNNVILAQNIVISALNHNFEDVSMTINQQGVVTDQITIENNVWIGANSSILAGVHIGEHVVVGAGSVVTKEIPPYCVVVGNPARILKKYDHKEQRWIKLKS